MDPRIRIHTKNVMDPQHWFILLSQMTGVAKMFSSYCWQRLRFDVMVVCEGGESGGELCGNNGGRPPARHGRQGPQSHRQDRGLSRQSGTVPGTHTVSYRASDPDFGFSIKLFTSQ
jgi:hypothetical protein